MLTTPEERYWLELNWPQTSRTVLRLIKPLIWDAVAETVRDGEPADKTWTRFVDNAARALDRKRAACDRAHEGGSRPPRHTMYATAISLLADASPIRDALEKARARLEGESVDLVVWGLMRDGLMRMRHRMTSDTENRSKTWRRLDRISREVHLDRIGQGLARDGDIRNAPEHYEAVALYIRSVYPTDHNLPRAADGVEAFFDEFDPQIMPIEDDDIAEINPEAIELLPDLNRARSYMAECVKQLDTFLRQIWDVDNQIGPVVYPNVSAYCAATGLDRRKFYRARDQAFADVAECVTGKFNPSMKVDQNA